MLGLEHAGRETVGSIACKHRHGGLRHDRALIHLLPDEMHGASGYRHAGGKHAGMRVETLERGEQGRMNIEMAVPPMLDEAFRMQPHEAGIAEELDLRIVERASSAWSKSSREAKLL